MMNHADREQAAIKMISLKTTLVGVVLVIVGATAAIVHFPWKLTSRRNTEDIVHRLNQEIVLGTTEEVRRLFENAITTQRTIVEMFTGGAIDYNKAQDRQELYLALLNANKNFTGISFGYPNGNFFAAQRENPENLRFVDSVWNAETKAAQRRIISYNVAQDVLNQTSIKDMTDNFYAPERPWYRQAIASNQDTWTAVYVFHTSKKPGITSSITLKNGSDVLGVVAVDVELGQISLYLQSFQVAKTGAVFIINSQKELVAVSTPDESTANVNSQGVPQLKHLNQAENRYLQLANQGINQNLATGDMPESGQKMTSMHEFVYTDSSTGGRYFISLAPIHYLDWMVVTVIPEADFLGEINKNNQRLLLAIIGMIVVAAGAAILLSERAIASPILSITQAAAEIEEGKFELSSLTEVVKRTDELGQLARVFQHMAREVYQREQQLKQQVQELRIEIDQTKKQQQVEEITGTDYFQNLQQKAKAMRRKNRNQTEE
ncbi:cache domain-containing protein [[Phormidium] sp. ETS-05]|uniref:cache domain-containing protein n=1 Tax=[Phormidium] sp. ETS-05 TaxID=222819 RepID=UPI0018EF0F21|nr:cache domain-containing protein [[Phormidium] sp. ETS-05]